MTIQSCFAGWGCRSDANRFLFDHCHRTVQLLPCDSSNDFEQLRLLCPASAIELGVPARFRRQRSLRERRSRRNPCHWLRRMRPCLTGAAGSLDPSIPACSAMTVARSCPLSRSAATIASSRLFIGQEPHPALRTSRMISSVHRCALCLAARGRPRRGTILRATSLGGYFGFEIASSTGHPAAIFSRMISTSACVFRESPVCRASLRDRSRLVLRDLSGMAVLSFAATASFTPVAEVPTSLNPLPPPPIPRPLASPG